MATGSQDNLDHLIKELERETREEELRQLKANAKVRWITPTVMAALLPLLAGFGIWVLGEIKQYSEGYRALKDKAGLERDKEALLKQKDSLNIEIGTLLKLKEHYAEQAGRLGQEVEAKQEIMDKTYLRAVFLGSEFEYALGHIKGLEPGPDRKALDAIKVDIMTLPKESAARLAKLLQRYDLMGTIINASRGSADLFQQAVRLIPASGWATRLRPMPSGSILPGRNVMFSDGPDGRRYYDITEGRFLTKDEAKEAQ
ncbi:hypothetical protein [Bradyrhizobium prioriisuperbiae]|uniref:hypothetical protein n=1 Tax=Bradyrhizobium prioriisuperbiae TaxID=2854389 RepID=UPI0028EEAF16|nr:hypothetical protein [Bradyrhizobium prioritasuperba]